MHCMDFRLTKAIREELERRNLLNDCDMVAIAGAAKPLISDEPAAWRETAFSHIELSKKLHGISRVCLMNHTDCGAYGGHAAFPAANVETKRHHDDLRAAREAICATHPELDVSMVLIHIDHDGSVSFEDIAP